MKIDKKLKFTVDKNYSGEYKDISGESVAIRKIDLINSLEDKMNELSDGEYMESTLYFDETQELDYYLRDVDSEKLECYGGVYSTDSLDSSEIVSLLLDLPIDDNYILTNVYFSAKSLDW